VAGVCFARNAILQIKISEACPVYMLIAPETGVTFGFLEDNTVPFYQELFWNIDWAGSLGWGGQRLYAVPEFGLVVAVTAGAYGSSQGGPPAALENLAGDTALNAFALPAALGR